MVEPLAPKSRIGPAVEEVNEGQGIGSESRQIVEGSRHGGGLRLVIGQLGVLCLQFSRQTIETPPPTIA